MESCMCPYLRSKFCHDLPSDYNSYLLLTFKMISFHVVRDSTCSPESKHLNQIEMTAGS
jgi:hypothetical protein